MKEIKIKIKTSSFPPKTYLKTKEDFRNVWKIKKK